jgi:hypothetical protein
MKLILNILFFLCSIQTHAQWIELGGLNALGGNNDIDAMCRDKYGNIYVSGIRYANSNPRVAKWNGVNWVSLGNQNYFNNGWVRTICTDPSGNIYAAGQFANAYGYQVAKWDGSSWSYLGGNSNGLNAKSYIPSICSDPSGNIYASAGINDSSKTLSKWNGSSWSALGNADSLAVSAPIDVIASDHLGNIYCSSAFGNSPYGGNVETIAKFNGTNWSKLGWPYDMAGAVGSRYSICIDSNLKIVVTGQIADSTFGRQFVAFWNGSSWGHLGGVNTYYFENTISTVSTDYKGNFYFGVKDSNRHFILQFDGQEFSELGGYNSLKANGEIFQVIADNIGGVYAAGRFTNVSGKQYVAYKDCSRVKTRSKTICQSQLPHTWFGKIFTSIHLNDTLMRKNIYGCDSIINLVVSLSQPNFYQSKNICSNQLPYNWFGKIFTISKLTDTIKKTNSIGCDSIINLNINILKPRGKDSVFVCNNQMPYIKNGKTFTLSHTVDSFILTNSNNCDSIVEFKVIFISKSDTSLFDTICPSALPYVWFGKTFNSSHLIDSVILINSLGCDSVIKLFLNLSNLKLTTLTKSVCSSDLPLNWNTKKFTLTHLYDSFVTKNAKGCDSIVRMMVSIKLLNKSITQNKDTLIAPISSSYQWLDCKTNKIIIGANKQKFKPSISGQYKVTLTQNGCSDTSVCISININSSLNNTAENLFIAIPNPFIDFINIDNESNSKSTLTISNCLGQILFQSILAKGNNRIDLSNLSVGVYSFKIQDENSKTQIMKILKQ